MHILAIITIMLFSSLSYGNEVNCMAKSIYMEARGEPLLGRVLVAGVVLNRVKHKNYPNSICGVIKRERDFQWKVRQPVNKKDWDDSLTLAKQILKKQTMVPKTFNATHFHNIDVKPVWRHKLRVVTKVGRHIFYRDI